MDEAIANGSGPSVARVCVEYDCRKPPVDQVWIVVQNRETGAVTNGYSQRVEFAQMPAYCDHCCHVSHKEIDCIVLGNKAKPPGSRKSRPLQMVIVERTAGHGIGIWKNMEKIKNLEKEKMACLEELAIQHLRGQPVDKGGISGVKDQQGKEIGSKDDPKNAGILVSNRFHEISEKDDGTQIRTET
ncbi:Uncharacterized protein TCM_003642 [Theobroma cacao]|uniref:DUF4283 domain-containing protein n=1 Tax=Theobroma cacao TaxID=3641 RepID=A0A061DW42_THECC|nr:Uncharacterized protein TCM_003642 [Theobroma cacao]